MPTKKLTDLFVERVKPPARGGRVEYFDASFPGLALQTADDPVNAAAHVLNAIYSRQISQNPRLRPAAREHN